MSVSLADIRSILDIMLGDTVSGTTSAAGNDEKTTLVDVALARWPDRWFAGKTAFVPKTETEAEEEQAIVEFHSPEGIVKVYKPFTNIIVIDRPYEIHLYSPSDKKQAINEGLVEAYPYFYKRIEDISLTGTGSGATEYAVPATFTDGFPDQVWLKTTSGTKISYEELFDVDFKEIAGSKKFYADIPTTKTILLIGKTFLTPLTNDASTIELTAAQAKIVCLKAAGIIYERQTAVVNAESAARFDALAGKKELEFQGLLRLHRMPALFKISLDWDWSK